MTFPDESEVITQEKGCIQFRSHHCKAKVEQGFSWQDSGLRTMDSTLGLIDLLLLAENSPDPSLTHIM